MIYDTVLLACIFFLWLEIKVLRDELAGMENRVR